MQRVYTVQYTLYWSKAYCVENIHFKAYGLQQCLALKGNFTQCMSAYFLIKKKKRYSTYTWLSSRSTIHFVMQTSLMVFLLLVTFTWFRTKSIDFLSIHILDTGQDLLQVVFFYFIFLLLSSIDIFCKSCIS